jgi:hypothetical protein
MAVVGTQTTVLEGVKRVKKMRGRVKDSGGRGTKFHTQWGGKPGNGKHSLVRSCCIREVNFTAHPASWDTNILKPVKVGLKVYYTVYN